MLRRSGPGPRCAAGVRDDHVYGDALSLVFLLAAPVGGVAGGLVVSRESTGGARVGWSLAGLAIGLLVTCAALVVIAFSIDSTI